MKYTSLLLLLMVIGVHHSTAQVNARMLQYPDVSATHIVFSYGGDIWVVSKQGGTAHKLTSAAGTERFARFSPDGSQIAFSGNYYGNIDVYTIPTLGGAPRRITHHGMNDVLIDWYPDGKSLLFTSSRESGKQRFSQFYKVSNTGGLPEKLIVPYGEFGTLSPDGNKIAYTPRSRAFRTWKRYRGGMAADVWLFDLEKTTADLIIKNDANDEFPMWSGNKIYFLSDRDKSKRFNLWSYDIASKEVKQLTNFTDFDVHFPAIGPQEIVFEAGGRIYLLNLSSEKYAEVQVNVVTDESTLLPKTEKANAYIQSASVSPDGKRAVFEARGEVFSVPAEHGPVLNLTQTSGVAERYPAWSPDGKSIAYWSDRSGEYELYVRDLKTNAERKLTSYGPGYRYQLFWSPDSKLIAFIDKAMDVYIYDIPGNRTIKVDKQLTMFEGALQNFSVSWSADSKYMAYAKNLESGNNAISIFDVAAQKARQVTSGFYNDMQPAFDPEGKYLYFLSNRKFTPHYSDFDNGWSYPNATELVAVALSKDTASPLAPKNDEVEVKEESKADETKKDDKSKGKAKSDKKEDEKKDDGPKPVAITWEGFEERLVTLPVAGGNIGSLQAVKGKVIYHKFPSTGSESKDRSIKYYDLEEREEKTIISNAGGFSISADGKKMMVVANGSFSIVDIGADKKLDKKMPVEQMEMTVTPREEWKQIFADAWRFERDFFYDANMHGVDWNAMRERYGKLVDDAITREDVNYIIGELIGEINASHTYRGGGDQQSEPQKAVGYLGIDWGLRNGAYYVKRIVKGAPWDSEVRSALDKSGLKIKEGDYILAVNNVPMDVTKDPFAAFEGQSKTTVELTVNSAASTSGAWKVLVETLADETRLRNLEWIESKRKRVDEVSQGKIGYVYVPSTGAGDGQYELVRMFYAQHNKPGMIVDERFNNGGQIPDRFIELLNRKPLAYWKVRDGQTWQWPPVGNFGPKAMLINEWSGSGGDAFPDYFRKAGLGPLIGMRTWGGLIGISGAPALIDGGGVTVPTFRMFNPDGTWFKEGHGVDPDIEVIDDPAQLAKGVDPQLERAIQEVMKQLGSKPTGLPQPPAPEVR